MNKQNKIILVIALVFIAVGLAWYGLNQKQDKPSQQANNPIKIGHITPLTGDAATYGEWEKEGADMALTEWNAKGGINGCQVMIVREDDKVDPAQSVTALNKMISVDKVQAVMGLPSSGETLASAPVAEANKVVLLSDGAAAIKVSSAGDYIFRIFPSTAQEGGKMTDLAKSLNKTNAAIIYISNDFGTDMANVISKNANQKGITIVDSESYSSDAIDFRTQLAKISGKNPDIIFLLGYPKDMGLILKQAGEIGIKSQFLAPDSFDDPSIVATAGKAAEGVIYVVPSDQATDKFKADFKTRYGKEASIMNALSYDAFNLLALAIQKGGDNGTAIKNELYKIHDYAGASGIITIDSNGDAINRPMVFKVIKDGKAVSYQP
jgi:branched-chain amino acid transport system substrate-binding protein